MELKTKALCLRAENYREKDKLLTLITADSGKITAEIRSANSPASKLRLAASPLCFGEYTLVKKGGRYLVTGCTVEDSFFKCWEDMTRYTAASVVLEAADKLTYDGADCGRECYFAVSALSAINYGDMYPFIVDAWFIGNLLPLAGIDVSEYDAVPERAALYIESFKGVETADLETLDISGGELFEILGYLNVILRNAMSAGLNSITEALKIINY